MVRALELPGGGGRPLPVPGKPVRHDRGPARAGPRDAAGPGPPRGGRGAATAAAGRSAGPAHPGRRPGRRVRRRRPVRRLAGAAGAGMAHASGHPRTRRGVPGWAAHLPGLGRRPRRPAYRPALGPGPDPGRPLVRGSRRRARRARPAVRALGVHLARARGAPRSALAACPGLPGARGRRPVGAARPAGARFRARPAARPVARDHPDRARGAGQHHPAGRHAGPVARRHRRSAGRAARGRPDQPGAVGPFGPVPRTPVGDALAAAGGDV